MKSYVLIAAAAGGLFLLPQMGLAQTAADTARTTANPHEVVNNSMPTGPGVGMNNPSQWGRANATYVKHEIDKAKADGKDVSAAQTQYAMGMKNLNTGMNKEAAQHFDAALRAVGVQPNAQGQNPGEPIRGHAAMPGTTHP